jgi:hypothetical protein
LVERKRRGEELVTMVEEDVQNSADIPVIPF